MLIIFAIAMSFLLTAMTVVVVDVATLYVQKGKLVSAVALAARNAASDGQRGLFISSGQVRIDAAAAMTACHAAINATMAPLPAGATLLPATCAITGSGATYSVSETEIVPLPLTPFGSNARVSANSSAQLVVGVNTGT